MQTYILRFEKPLPFKVSPQYGDVNHYFGRSSNANRRYEYHLSGRGSLITKMAVKLGIKFKLEAVYNEDIEYKMINGQFEEYCPCILCNRYLWPQ